MALFQHGNRKIAYHLDWAPFHCDLLLLQGSGQSLGLWTDFLTDMKSETPHGGRILTCEWAEVGKTKHELAEDLARLLQTLATRSLHVVALADAVEVVGEVQAQQPMLIQKTLFFTGSGPKGEELKRAIGVFCPF